MSKITKSYDVSEIKKDYYVFWSLCTACRFECEISLVDETGTVYFKYYKDKTSGNVEMTPLGQGNAQIKGNKLELIVMSNTSIDEIKQSINSFNVTDAKASTVGHGYNFCIEDWTDEDYNDIFIDLTGWVSGK